ncbi:hypothetical protein ACT7DB_03930 [Bacillus cereus]
METFWLKQQKTFHLKSSHIIKKDVRGELEMTKEQLVRMAAKLGLKQGESKSGGYFKDCP